MNGTTQQQPGRGRVGIVEDWELRRGKGGRNRDANSGAFKGIAFVVVAIVLLVVGGWYAGRPMVGPVVAGFFEDSPGIVRLPLVSDIVAAEFADRVDTPASSSSDEIEFVIEPGQTIDDIEESLVDEGLLNDTLAFRYAVVVDRVDELLRPGTYTMTATMTPGDLAARLALPPDPPTPVTTLDMRFGRRIEQVVAYLQQETEETDLETDPREFLRLARNPTAEMREEFDFLAQLPEGNSLEGFLAGGTYEEPIDVTGEELVYQMLDEFDKRYSRYIRQANNKGIDFYEALTIASLVEKEAKADSDRAKIAGVYWNRLDPKVNSETGGLMQADPTVIYATDSMTLADINVRDWDEYVFWDLLGVADYSTVDVDRRYASYQTYQNPGLPDTPIATPSTKSLEAALNPFTKKKLLYFYACPDSDKHRFARKLKGHQKNIDRCD